MDQVGTQLFHWGISKYQEVECLSLQPVSLGKNPLITHWDSIVPFVQFWKWKEGVEWGSNYSYNCPSIFHCHVSPLPWFLRICKCLSTHQCSTQWFITRYTLQSVISPSFAFQLAKFCLHLLGANISSFCSCVCIYFHLN